MQNKEQKISPIKQRILQFVDTLSISKRDFYAHIEVSRGTLEASSGITEDVLAKFIAKYPEINVEWLINGTGSMLRGEGEEQLNSSSEVDTNKKRASNLLETLENFSIDKAREVALYMLIDDAGKLSQANLHLAESNRLLSEEIVRRSKEEQI